MSSNSTSSIEKFAKSTSSIEKFANIISFSTKAEKFANIISYLVSSDRCRSNFPFQKYVDLYAPFISI